MEQLVVRADLFAHDATAVHVVLEVRADLDLEVRPALGQRLAAARPKGGVVGTILRGDEIILPRGQDVLHPGDDVIVFAMPEAIPQVEALFD